MSAKIFILKNYGFSELASQNPDFFQNLNTEEAEALSEHLKSVAEKFEDL